MKRRLFTLMLLGGAVLPWVAGAAELSSEDADAIHAVVQSQLDAFAEDDAVKAFSLSTSATRSRIGSADDFLRMVKQYYTPIYRHRRALFQSPEVVNGRIVLRVRLTDPDSNVWLALYHVQRESDGAWKIAGCKLIETASVSV